ncbi:MAG: MFS transporter, partial [Nocardioides sp.]
MRTRNRHLLAWSTAVNALGNGAYLPFSLVLLVELTGIPLARVGLTMTAAALLALALMPLMGTLIDRIGPRRALVAAHLLRATAFAAFPALHSLEAFAAAAVLSALTERVARIAQPALIGETADAAHTDRLVALTRSLNNAGMGLGGLAAALLAASHTTGTYLAAAWLNAATFIAAAIMVTAIRPGPATSAKPAVPEPCDRSTYRQVLTNPTFTLLVTSTALAAFGYSALTIFLPLYALSLHTPAWTSGMLFSLNTVLCALAGVPVAGAARPPHPHPHPPPARQLQNVTPKLH